MSSGCHILYFLLAMNKTLGKNLSKIAGNKKFLKSQQCVLGNTGVGHFRKLVLIAMNVEYNLKKLA
jgi:hypothetical protein